MIWLKINKMTTFQCSTTYACELRKSLKVEPLRVRFLCGDRDGRCPRGALLTSSASSVVICVHLWFDGRCSCEVVRRRAHRARVGFGAYVGLVAERSSAAGSLFRLQERMEVNAGGLYDRKAG